MRLTKRLFDIVVSGIGLIFLLPVFALVAAWIAIEDGRPIFFRQNRVGRGGKIFSLLKFRSMSVAPIGLSSLITVAGDARVTRVGRFIRQTKIDELPQLWNVFRGQMSFVGPRPEVEKYVALYNAKQREILRLTPGITDPASLQFRDESALLAQVSTQGKDPERYYIETLSPEKVRISLEYGHRATLASDLGVILRTVFNLR